MPSLIELVERVNKGELIDPAQLEIYQDSSNSAEKFLAHHAHALLQLRQCNQHMLSALEAIDYSDQKVLNEFVSVCGFLNQPELRAAPVIKFGASAIGRREFAVGLEAIQNGVAQDLASGSHYTADRENCLFVASQYERAGQCIGWSPAEPLQWNNKLTKIAYVTGGIVDEDAQARFMLSLGKHLDGKRFKLQVYSTEAAARREKSSFIAASYTAPSSKRGRETIEQLKQRKVGYWSTPLEGDLVNAARELASQLVRDQVDVVFFDTMQNDPIAAVVAGWEIARVKVNLARRAPLFAGNIDCVTYLDSSRFESEKDFWARRGIDSRFILEGIDADETMSAPPQRSAYGIPEQAVVLATAGSDLERTVGPEFVDAIVNILRAHPHAVYLVIGDGDLSWQKRRFESAGVGKRVGYANRRKDLPGFLRIADIYLAEFPSSSSAGVLQAMSAERPVVAMQWSDAPEHSQAAAFVGSEATIVGRDANAYIERVSKAIRDAGYRTKLGKTMRARLEQHFAFNQTARQIEELCDQLIQQRSEKSGETTISADPSAPAAVAA